MDVMKMIEAFTTYLANFNSKFEGHNSRTQFYRDITLNARDVWWLAVLRIVGLRTREIKERETGRERKNKKIIKKEYLNEV